MASEARRKSFQSRTNKPRSQVVAESRTKFDEWLESHVKSGEIVDFVFKKDPLGYEENPGRLVMRRAKIFTVDRYMIYIECSDSDEDEAPVWVAKDNIISAA